MQLNPRLLVNLLAILVRILINLLAKPTKSGYRGAIGAPGAPGTMYRSKGLGPWANNQSHGSRRPKGHPCWGEYTPERLLLGYGRRIPPCSLVSSPDGPPNARGPLEVLVGPFTDFSDFLGSNILVIERVSFTLTTCSHVCFFFRNRPPEELDNKRSSARRGEFDSSTPEAIGVLLGQMFLARRFRVVLVDNRNLARQKNGGRKPP